MKIKISCFMFTAFLLPLSAAADIRGIAAVEEIKQVSAAQYILAADFGKGSGASALFGEDEETGISEQNDSFFTGRLFVESENYTSAVSDPVKRNLKNELRTELELRAGSEKYYFFTRADFYGLNHYGEEGELSEYSRESQWRRNGAFSGPACELRFPEFYLNLQAGKLRFRAGNQIYSWGTADAWNPAAFMNSYDLREYFLKDDDEMRQGVPSVSVMAFLGKVSLEGVVVPVHIPARVPEQGIFWDLQPEDESVVLAREEYEGAEIQAGNAGAGARASFSLHGLDFSISYYHGPDNEPLMVPESFIMAMPSSLVLETETFNVNKLGADFSAAAGDFVFQLEGVYSPDKRGVVKQDLSNIYTVQFPFETETSDYVHYTAGFNYFIPLNRIFSWHEGDTVLTVEWQHPHYFNKDLERPFLAKVVSCKLEDNLFDNRLKLSIKFIAETEMDAYVTWPKIAYDFQNGLKLELSYVNFSAPEPDSISFEENSIISFMRDKDIVIWSARYELQ